MPELDTIYSTKMPRFVWGLSSDIWQLDMDYVIPGPAANRSGRRGRERITKEFRVMNSSFGYTSLSVARAWFIFARLWFDCGSTVARLWLDRGSTVVPLWYCIFLDGHCSTVEACTVKTVSTTCVSCCIIKSNSDKGNSIGEWYLVR